MKKLRLYRESKTSEFDELGKINVEDLKSLLDDVKDQFDEFEYEVKVDKMLEESYNLKYHILNDGLGFSFNTSNFEESFEDSIDRNKKNLEEINRYVLASHELMRRLKNMGYMIAFYSTNFSYKGNNNILETDIRISKKD